VGKADESHLFQPRGKNITQRIVSNFGYSSVNTKKYINTFVSIFRADKEEVLGWRC
jgi:hypothetical protein